MEGPTDALCYAIRLNFCHSFLFPSKTELSSISLPTPCLRLCLETSANQSSSYDPVSDGGKSQEA
jgi:hypothetical protein